MKANVIPEHVALTLDIRALPGWDEDKIRTMLAGILGDLWDDTAVEIFDGGASAPSPVSAPLWKSLQRAANRLTPGDQNVPFLQPGITDGRFFRRLGATAYGYQLFSDRIGFGQMVAVFHGDNERVDRETLRLSTELSLFVPQDLLS